MPLQDSQKLTIHLKNLERVLDSLPEGLIAHDLERRIIFINRAAEAMTGHKREDVLGQDCHRAFGRPFCGKLCLFNDKNTDKAVDKITRRVSFAAKHGPSVNVEMELSALKNETGQIVGVLATFRDYATARKTQLKNEALPLNRFGGIVGRDPRMLDVFRQISDIAAYDFPVYIYGETGTGKELVARAIHDAGPRKDQNFVPINCGALPEGLLESELFGHVRGAFSGAVKDKTGRLELAHNGTVFLDEIGELPLNAQTRLLRFLQEGVLERVGSTQSIKVNAHVICATNKDLKQEVSRGNFREDLFYRLNVIPLTLPPLRERKNDILLLVNHFLAQTAGHYNAKDVPKVTGDAMAALMAYDWPGNVRELQNAVQFAYVKSRGAGVIGLESLPMELQSVNPKPKLAAELITTGDVLPEYTSLTAETINAAIAKARGNKTRAAKLLGISRATLYRHLPKP